MHLGYFLGGADIGGSGLQVFHDRLRGHCDAPPQVHGVHASCHRLSALGQDGPGQHCCCSRSCNALLVSGASSSISDGESHL